MIRCQYCCLLSICSVNKIQQVNISKKEMRLTLSSSSNYKIYFEYCYSCRSGAIASSSNNHHCYLIVCSKVSKQVF